MAELRKMTMGEVAEIAGDPKETIRARMNRGIAPQEKTYGWARLGVASTVHLAVHAELLRRTTNHQIALDGANFIAESLANLFRYTPDMIKRKGMLDGNYLIFRCIYAGIWTNHWCRSQDEALHELGSHVFDSQHLDAAGFYFLNVSTLTDWAMDRIFDLQGIEGNAAEAPK